MAGDPCLTFLGDTQQLCDESRARVSHGRIVTSHTRTKPLTPGGAPCLVRALLSKPSPTAATSPPVTDCGLGKSLGHKSISDAHCGDGHLAGGA